MPLGQPNLPTDSPPMPPVGGPGGAPPQLPKSPVAGPGGPGASPMLSPGGGGGNKAAAVQIVKALLPGLLHASMAFEAGSKEQQALIRAVSALNPIFGKAEGANMVPAGLATLAQTARKGPLSAAPPPGLIPTDKPPPGMPMPPPGGEMEAA